MNESHHYVMGSYLISSSQELKNFSRCVTLQERDSVILQFSDNALFAVVEILWNIIVCGTLKPSDSLMTVLREYRKLARNLIKPHEAVKTRRLLLRSPSTFKELLCHLARIALKHSI